MHVHEGVGALPLPDPRWSPGQRLYVSVLKPAFDRGAALVAFLLVLPLFVAVAIAVRLSLGAGIVFKQPRIGLNGQLFTVYKFRTLRHSRRQASLPIPQDRRKTHKHPRDPRLTPTGAFLRRWSLDELPQLLNILLGHMSVVGPRPELPSIVRSYEPWQHKRHAVRPGLAGLWQISMRGVKPMHECVDIDVEYVERVSLTTDLGILIKTPAKLLGVNRGF